MPAKMKAKAGELKSAMGAVQALSKKLPGGGVGSGDAKCALLFSERGFSLVSSTESTTVEIALPSMGCVGEPEPSELSRWDGASDLSDEMLIGFAAETELHKLLGKYKKDDELELELDRATHRLFVSRERAENKFDVVDPRMIKSSFNRMHADARTAFTLSADQAQWFADTVGVLADYVQTSVQHPGFGCVGLDAKPSADKTLRLSGNSNTNGFSAIYQTVVASAFDFEMLVPKGLAQGLKSFVAEIGTDAGDLSVGVVLEDAKGREARAKTLVLRTGAYSMSLACSGDDFPFRMLDGIASGKGAKIAVSAKMRYNAFKSMLDKTCVSAREGGVSGLEVSDGGTLTLTQQASALVSDVTARDSGEVDEMLAFADDAASVKTAVRTDVLNSLSASFKGAGELEMSITASATGNGMLMLSHDYGIAKETAVLMGVRTR